MCIADSCGLFITGVFDMLVCYQVSDGSLTVLSITREDRGAYTCRAFSPQGEAIHTTRLLVQGNYMC